MLGVVLGSSLYSGWERLQSRMGKRMSIDDAAGRLTGPIDP